MSNETDGNGKTMEQAISDSDYPKIPKDRYKLKIKSAELKVGKTGDKNKFFEFACELINNPPIIIDGKQEDINGTPGTKRFFLTEKSLSRLGKLHQQLGLPLSLTLEQILAAPNTSMYVGGTFNAICESKPSPQVRQDGTPITNSNGEQVIYFQFDIGDVV